MHPLHVIVDSGPSDPIEIWALRFAIAAFVVALATLGAVAYQINVARQELDAVKEDLQNNNLQMADFQRRPDLYLEGSATLRTGVEAGIDFTVYVKNSGTRVADWAMLELLEPRSGSPNLESIAYGDQNMLTVDGVLYYRHAIDIARRVYPNGAPIPSGISIVRTDRSPFKWRWRIHDAYSSYPKDRYGQFDAHFDEAMYELKIEPSKVR